jgi:hypothetical protein
MQILFLIIGMIFIIVGLHAQYSYRKRRVNAKFTIPMRRIYFWISLIITINLAIELLFFTSQIDVFNKLWIFILCLGMVLWYISSDILISDNGIYCFMKFTPWENITKITKDFMALYIHRTSGVFKKYGYANFIWKIKNTDIDQLKKMFPDKIKIK